MRLPLPSNDATLRPLIFFYPLPICLCLRWTIGREEILSDMAIRLLSTWAWLGVASIGCHDAF